MVKTEQYVDIVNTNTGVTGVLEKGRVGREREGERQGDAGFEEIINKYFLNLMKDSNPQIQEIRSKPDE